MGRKQTLTEGIPMLTGDVSQRDGGWSKALLALFACHPNFLASAKLFAVPKVPKVPKVPNL